MRQDSIATRAKLISAAERLFASKGIDAVSMNEVQRAAGQKNKSALQYHFGTKEGLLQAIIDKHAPAIELRRHAWLDEIEASDNLETRELIRALVVPIFEKLDDPDGGPEYLAINAQLVGSPKASLLWANAMRANRGADRLMRLLERSTAPLPTALRLPRYLMVTELLFHAISDFGRLSSAERPLIDPSARELFCSNLVDVLTAIASAPISAPTQALL